MRKNSRVTEYILMEEEEGEAMSSRHSVEILINEDRDRKAKSLLQKFDFAKFHKFITESSPQPLLTPEA